jgi:hypothetical protein
MILTTVYFRIAYQDLKLLSIVKKVGAKYTTQSKKSVLRFKSVPNIMRLNYISTILS